MGKLRAARIPKVPSGPSREALKVYVQRFQQLQAQGKLAGPENELPVPLLELR